MALLGMGANVRCNSYFPGYYSTRDLIFGVEGNTRTSSNGNSELKNDCYQLGPFPVSSPGHLLGYNKELLKQTILKHEAIFRDQIQELHRVYQKQRDLMDEIKKKEVYEHNLRLETSWSSSFLSSKNAQKISCSPNLPWLTGQSSVSIAESTHLPLASVQEKSQQICPASACAPTAIEVSSEDSKLSESKYRKVGKKMLDLRLPADEYIDSEEVESLENERVAEVPSAYTLNGISQFVCNSGEKPDGANSNGSADLNVPFKFVEEAAVKFDDLGDHTNHTNNSFNDLFRRMKLGSHNLPNDVIQNLNRRQDLDACLDDPLPNQEKKHGWLSSSDSNGQSGGVLDSLAKFIDTGKQSVSVEPLSKKLEQLNGLQCFHSLHQVNQGSWTERKFSSGESSVGTQGPNYGGLLRPSSASHTCAPYQLVSEAYMISSGMSPEVFWKTPVSDFAQSPVAVQAIPHFSTSPSLGESCKSLVGMSGFTRDELYQCKSITSDAILYSQNFLLSSSFHGRSKLLDLPSISTNDVSSCNNNGSSASRELTKYVKGSQDVGTPKNINLNIMPADYSGTTAFQSIQFTGEENQFQDSRRGFPWLKEKPVPKGKPNEESKISTQIESVILKPYNSGGTHGSKLKNMKESDWSRDDTLSFPINGKQQTSSDPHSFHGIPYKVCQNLSKNQWIEGIEKDCISDVNSPCNHVADVGEKIPCGEHLIENEQKKHEHLAGIIDLNSCMNEDENVSMDIDFQPPVSPENKECSPPRGDSDENQLEMTFQLVGQEDLEAQEEQVRTAAEALASISGVVSRNVLQMATRPPSESFLSSPLHWFAGIVSTMVDHPENEVKVDFSGKANDLEKFLPADIDYFELMTLQLTETKVPDFCYKASGQNEQEGGLTSPTQPRKCRANRGRQRKDFQSDILPSLASLSRYEVTEDLQTIGTLMEAAGTHSETGYLRSTGRNVLARGRRRSCTSASNITDLMVKQLNSNTELGIEKKGLISWGKICRKRRGQRFPIRNPQFILSQAYN